MGNLDGNNGSQPLQGQSTGTGTWTETGTTAQSTVAPAQGAEPTAQCSGVPAEVTVWTKVKNFLFKEITITTTPKQQKVLQEVRDFWNQEITVKSMKDFWFQKIEIIDNITL